MGWGSLTLGKAIYFTQSTHSNVTLTQKHLHRHTQNHVSPNIWHPHDPINLAHKIKDHGCFLIHFIIFTDTLSINLEYRVGWGQQWRKRLGWYSRPDRIFEGEDGIYNLLFKKISNWQKSFKNGIKNSHFSLVVSILPHLSILSQV